MERRFLPLILSTLLVSSCFLFYPQDIEKALQEVSTNENTNENVSP